MKVNIQCCEKCFLHKNLNHQEYDFHHNFAKIAQLIQKKTHLEVIKNNKQFILSTYFSNLNKLHQQDLYKNNANPNSTGKPRFQAFQIYFKDLLVYSKLKSKEFPSSIYICNIINAMQKIQEIFCLKSILKKLSLESVHEYIERKLPNKVKQNKIIRYKQIYQILTQLNLNQQLQDKENCYFSAESVKISKKKKIKKSQLLSNINNKYQQLFEPIQQLQDQNSKLVTPTSQKQQNQVNKKCKLLTKKSRSVSKRNLSSDKISNAAQNLKISSKRSSQNKQKMPLPKYVNFARRIRCKKISTRYSNLNQKTEIINSLVSRQYNKIKESKYEYLSKQMDIQIDYKSSLDQFVLECITDSEDENESQINQIFSNHKKKLSNFANHFASASQPNMLSSGQINQISQSISKPSFNNSLGLNSMILSQLQSKQINEFRSSIGAVSEVDQNQGFQLTSGCCQKSKQQNLQLFKQKEVEQGSCMTIQLSQNSLTQQNIRSHQPKKLLTADQIQDINSSNKTNHSCQNLIHKLNQENEEQLKHNQSKQYQHISHLKQDQWVFQKDQNIQTNQIQFLTKFEDKQIGQNNIQINKHVSQYSKQKISRNFEGVPSSQNINQCMKQLKQNINQFQKQLKQQQLDQKQFQKDSIKLVSQIKPYLAWLVTQNLELIFSKFKINQQSSTYKFQVFNILSNKLQVIQVKEQELISLKRQVKLKSNQNLIAFIQKVFVSLYDVNMLKIASIQLHNLQKMLKTLFMLPTISISTKKSKKCQKLIKSIFDLKQPNNICSENQIKNAKNICKIIGISEFKQVRCFSNIQIDQNDFSKTIFQSEEQNCLVYNYKSFCKKFQQVILWFKDPSYTVANESIEYVPTIQQEQNQKIGWYLELQINSESQNNAHLFIGFSSSLKSQKYVTVRIWRKVYNQSQINSYQCHKVRKQRQLIGQIKKKGDFFFELVLQPNKYICQIQKQEDFKNQRLNLITYCDSKIELFNSHFNKIQHFQEPQPVEQLEQ